MEIIDKIKKDVKMYVNDSYVESSIFDTNLVILSNEIIDKIKTNSLSKDYMLRLDFSYDNYEIDGVFYPISYPSIVSTEYYGYINQTRDINRKLRLLLIEDLKYYKGSNVWFDLDKWGNIILIIPLQDSLIVWHIESSE